MSMQRLGASGPPAQFAGLQWRFDSFCADTGSTDQMLRHGRTAVSYSHISSETIIASMGAYPRATAWRQRSRITASVTLHSPSDRNMTTGALCKRIIIVLLSVVRESLSSPLRTPMVLHAPLRLLQGHVEVSPAPSTVWHHHVQ